MGAKQPWATMTGKRRWNPELEPLALAYGRDCKRIRRVNDWLCLSPKQSRSDLVITHSSLFLLGRWIIQFGKVGVDPSTPLKYPAVTGC